MVNVIECCLKVSEFDLDEILENYVHIQTNTLGKYMNRLIPSTVG